MAAPSLHAFTSGMKHWWNLSRTRLPSPKPSRIARTWAGNFCFLAGLGIACSVDGAWLDHVTCCITTQHQNKVIFPGPEPWGLLYILTEIGVIGHPLPEHAHFITTEDLLRKVAYLFCKFSELSGNTEAVWASASVDSPMISEFLWLQHFTELASHPCEPQTRFSAAPHSGAHRG